MPRVREPGYSEISQAATGDPREKLSCSELARQVRLTMQRWPSTTLSLARYMPAFKGSDLDSGCNLTSHMGERFMPPTP